MFSSWVPFGLAIKRGFDVETAYIQENVEPGREYATSVLEVARDQQIQLAVKLDLRSLSIRRNSSSDSDPYDALYSFPFRYVVRDEAGSELYSEDTFVAWDQGSRSYDRDEVSETAGHVIVESSLDKFPAPRSGRVRITYRLSSDDVHDVTVNEAQVILYHRVHGHGPAIATGIALALLGFLLAAIGGLLLLVRALRESAPAGETEPQQALSETVAKSSRDMAMWCHLSALSGYFVPFGGLIGPVVIWAMKKDGDGFVNRHGIAAINFRISMYLYAIVCFVLMLVVVGFFALFALGLVDLVFTVIAAVKASEGKPYRYPLSLRLIRSGD